MGGTERREITEEETKHWHVATSLFFCDAFRARAVGRLHVGGAKGPQVRLYSPELSVSVSSKTLCSTRSGCQIPAEVSMAASWETNDLIIKMPPSRSLQSETAVSCDPLKPWFSHRCESITAGLRLNCSRPPVLRMF